MSHQISKKRGRPKSVNGGALKINVYLSKEDLAEDQEIINRLGFNSISEYYRFVRIKFIKKILPEIDEELIKEVNGIK